MACCPQLVRSSIFTDKKSDRSGELQSPKPSVRQRGKMPVGLVKVEWRRCQKAKIMSDPITSGVVGEKSGRRTPLMNLW